MKLQATCTNRQIVARKMVEEGGPPDPQLARILESTPGARLLTDADDIGEAQERNRMKNEVEENEEMIKHGRARLEEMRQALETLDERLWQCEAIKAQANEHFTSGREDVALKGYLTAIWLLKRGRPAVSRSL
eukprot:922326-Prymnesium_polylepis.1